MPDENDLIDNQKVYDGCKLTLETSCFLTLQFARKYKLSRKAQKDLLSLIALHFPEGQETRFPKTCNDLVEKAIPSLPKVRKVKVCQTCSKGIDQDTLLCPSDHQQSANTPKKDESYFIPLPIEAQLKTIVEGMDCTLFRWY
jgi:hypothetical protein